MSDELKDIRRKLHKIPELGFEEHKTSNMLKEIIKSYGYEYIEVAKTGLLVFIEGEENKTIAFRCDIDGLAVMEKTEVEFKSCHEGYMHACGHDGHMTMVLGLLKHLSTITKPKKNILLIFQPAEESPGGAKVIIKEGVLSKYNVESIFGFHLYPEIEEGKVGLVSGPLMAQSAEINITVKSTGAHGAMPHLGVDGIYVAVSLINAYQSIISRNIEPIEGAVLTIGKIEGGTVRNALAQNVRMEGIVRCFDKAVFKLIKDRIIAINKAMEAMHNVKIEFQFNESYPPVVNDDKLFNICKKAIGEADYKLMKPIMTAEDFSYYQEVVPGMFMMLGTRNESKGYIHPLHSNFFNFDENVLEKGVDIFVKILKELNVIV